MWQKCPVCIGTGNNPSLTTSKCKVCNGTGVISQITGLPPSQAPVEPFKGLLQGIGGEKCKTCGHIVCLCNKTLM